MMHFLYHVSADQNQDGLVKLYFLDKHAIDICLLKKNDTVSPYFFLLSEARWSHSSYSLILEITIVNNILDYL